MSRDFWRDVEGLKVEKSNHPDTPRERGIRMYRSASPETFGDEARWSLQLRAPVTLANGCDGRDFMIATAPLSIQDLTALRDEAELAIRDVRRDQERLIQISAKGNGDVEDHAFTPSRYAEICALCGGHPSDGNHQLSTRVKTLNLRRPKKEEG